jgi:hypothetical protein
LPPVTTATFPLKSNKFVLHVSPDCVLASEPNALSPVHTLNYSRAKQNSLAMLSDQSGTAPDIAGALPNTINIIVDAARIAKIKAAAT